MSRNPEWKGPRPRDISGARWPIVLGVHFRKDRERDRTIAVDRDRLEAEQLLTAFTCGAGRSALRSLVRRA
jgi:hypothetical protein